MKHHSTRGLRAVAALAIASVATIGVVATTAGAQSSKVPGVTDKSVKFGFIYSGTGAASSTFQDSDKACKARVDRANREGGVNGRKIEIEVIDDKSSAREPHRGEGPGREPRRLRRDQQLVVRVPARTAI